LILQFPSDPILPLLEIDLINDLVIKNKLTLEDFYSSKSEIKYFKAELGEVEKEDIPISSKRRKLQYINKNFYKSAFINDKQDTAFCNKFTIAYKKKKEIDNLNKKSYDEKYDLFEERKLATKKNGAKIFAKQIILLNPHYEINEKTIKTLVRSEAEKSEFIEETLRSAKKVGIRVQALNPTVLNEQSIKEYNNLAILNDWLGEYITNYKIDMIPSSVSNIYNTKELIDTKIVCTTGVTKDKYGDKNYYFFCLNLETQKIIYRNYLKNVSSSQIKRNLRKDFLIITK